jgi:hypothetical protein
MNLKRHSIALLVTAVTCLTTGFNQPAKALGGGVVVSQFTSNDSGCSTVDISAPNSCTNVTVGGNIVASPVSYGYVPGQAVNFNFTLNNSNAGVISAWGNIGGIPYYRFDNVGYTALAGNTFTGTFIPGNIAQDGTLKIYQSGLVVFDIASIIDPEYTGFTLNATANPLVRYNVAFSKGSNFANVPNSSPGSIPSIASLLAGAAGSYTQSTGEILSNVENKATYASTPGPLPILGVGVAFGQSRRLRKRIKSRQAKCC